MTIIVDVNIANTSNSMRKIYIIMNFKYLLPWSCQFFPANDIFLGSFWTTAICLMNWDYSHVNTMEYQPHLWQSYL